MCRKRLGRHLTRASVAGPRVPAADAFSAGKRAGVTFEGFTVDGDNPALTSGVVFNGSDVDAEIGIYGTGISDSHSVIVNNVVRNIGEQAVWLTDASTGGPKTAGGRIAANRVDNCIVIENFDGTPPAHPASVVGNNSVSSFTR